MVKKDKIVENGKRYIYKMHKSRVRESVKVAIPKEKQEVNKEKRNKSYI